LGGAMVVVYDPNTDLHWAAGSGPDMKKKEFEATVLVNNVMKEVVILEGGGERSW